MIPTLVESVDAPADDSLELLHKLVDQSLKELRLRRKYSQQHVSEVMRTSQGEVSRIEKRTDLHLATLRSYIRAIGGELVLIAQFSDEGDGEIVRIAI